uniref:Ig-like domain-containing protein n=1 Tax=Astyanax mexicanus TaxID=7994 RepID=A0A3B1IJ64_ASTMX
MLHHQQPEPERAHSMVLLSVGQHIHAYGFIFAATHYLQFLLTGVTPGTSFPEFSAVGQLDGEQGGYYDSTIRTVILKADWVKKSKDTEHWKMMTQRIFEDQQLVMERLGNIMKHFNQTEGVHTVQWVYRCELDDDGSKRGYMQCGYDGEDFLSLDLNSLSWIAPVPQALITKHKWEETGHVRFQKHFLLNECIGWLQKYVEYGRSTLERKVAPEVSLFQKDSSSPVVCHATGFFPKAVMISWQKNGEDLNEGVELRETVPNQDGTFQKRSILTLSPEELNRNQYTCIVQHEGLKKKLQVSDRTDEALSDVAGEESVGIIVGAVMAVLLVITGCAGVFISKKKTTSVLYCTGTAPQSPDLNPVEQLWDVVEQEIHIMDV